MLVDTLSPSEVLGLVLCALVLVYVIFNSRTLTSSRYGFFTAAFLCVSAAFLCTNLEELFLEDLLNVIEHTLMATATLLIALGCRRILLSGNDREEEAA